MNSSAGVAESNQSQEHNETQHEYFMKQALVMVLKNSYYSKREEALTLIRERKPLRPVRRLWDAYWYTKER